MTILGLLSRFALGTFLSLSLLVQTALALDIREVSSSKGIKALLVEDYTLPLVSLSFSFKGGALQDADGKEGAARLMVSLLDEGAGDMDSSAYRAFLEENGIEISFSSSTGSISGGMRAVAEDIEQASEMLRLPLVSPRFDEDAIARMRNAIRLGIIRSQKDPRSEMGKQVRKALFEQHPYSRSVSGNEETIDAITRDDIIAAHAGLLAKDNLTVGVVGAINESDLKSLLDKVFGDLPNTAKLRTIDEVSPALGEEIFAEMPVPNSSISLIYKGLKRSDPDFFAAHLMNHILGGSSFSSRLYKEIREKRGLAYGVYSGVATFDHSAYLSVGTSTRVENQDTTLELLRAEVRKMAEEGVTAEELEAAKRFVAGSYAINNLDTSGKIARVLVAIQTQDLGINYIDERQKYIEAVTLEDVNRIARELLSVEPTQVIVGPATQ